ncbi:MAG: hypothetical protein ACPG77_03445, partial [Nannocystaceae bacterium]
SQTYADIVAAMQTAGLGKNVKFAPRLEKPFGMLVNALMRAPRKSVVAYAASLMKVFLPYLTNNTVFDNHNVVTALGKKPAVFGDYAYGLFKFASEGKFAYPYKPWPEAVSPQKVA